MTPSPDVPTKRPGLPAWGWGLIGCAFLAPVPILAAILFPVFAQAREKARQVSCMSNMKQQGLALMMYAQDYDEVMPPKNAKWMDTLLPYIKDEKVFRCPSVITGQFGYAFSPELFGKKFKNIASPATTTAIFESTNLSRNATTGTVAYRHRKFANTAFADGHVKAEKAQQED